MSTVSPEGERKPVLRLLDRLQKAQLRLAALALVLMMLVTVVDVFLRYTFNRPVRGSYDFVEAMLVVFVFHGMAACFFGRANIVIDVVDTFVGERIVAALIRLSDFLSVAALVVLAWAMTGPARQAFDYGDRKLELDLPLYVLWIVALLGIAGTILCALGVLVARAAGPHRRGPA
jgi:TRAP-type C4-dicarboxylate transport system permease small subunit